jgi:hypothetical protein
MVCQFIAVSENMIEQIRVDLVDFFTPSLISCRAWYMFKLFGHNNVGVLNVRLLITSVTLSCFSKSISFFDVLIVACLDCFNLCL